MRAGWLTIVLVAAGIGVSPVHAHLLPRLFLLDRLNSELCGKVVDYTHNHGKDRRIYWECLGKKRDMYLYLPPRYDPCKRYPLAIYLHGFQSDERNFIHDFVKHLDQAIARGKLPPIIVAAPDASPDGMDCFVTSGTFYLNSNLGNYEDFLVKDVYGFLMRHYPIRPEPEAHVLLGVSMGGSAAFNKVMKFRDKFGIAATFAPPLNLRWISCRGCYFDNFDPNCWGWRTDFSDGRDPVGIFLNGLVKIRLRQLIYPLYGRDNPCLTELVARDSPIEMLDRLDIKPGFAEFYIAYGGEDEFNLDAQVESFLYRARQRGVAVTVDYLPDGKHDTPTGEKMLPGIFEWLRPRLEPYSPH